jgi:hypothetical protein
MRETISMQSARQAACNHGLRAPIRGSSEAHQRLISDNQWPSREIAPGRRDRKQLIRRSSAIISGHQGRSHLKELIRCSSATVSGHQGRSHLKELIEEWRPVRAHNLARRPIQAAAAAAAAAVTATATAVTAATVSPLGE